MERFVASNFSELFGKKHGGGDNDESRESVIEQLSELEKNLYELFFYANEGRANDSREMMMGTVETVYTRLVSAIRRQKKIEEAYNKAGS